MGVIEGVESVAASATYEFGMEAVLSAVRRGFIYACCVIVVAANRLSTVPLFDPKSARLSK